MNTISGKDQDQAIVDCILQLEARRWSLLVAGDFDEYEKMLADDLVYIHTTGRVDSKESLMTLRRTMPIQFLKYEEEDQNVRVFHGVTAIMTGRIRNWQTLPSGSKIADSRFTSAWVRSSEHSDDWRFSSYQATAIPPPKN